VLRAKSGSLAQTPLPLLLHALLLEERSATLELKLRNLEKRVHFDEGSLVGCESNLLHETLGKGLVAKGKLTEAQHHGLLTDSAATGKSFQALLLERQLVSGSELFKLLQANLGHTLLDAFRWGDAQWKVLPLEEVDTPIRMNTAQLVYTGAAQLPPETVATHFALRDEQVLALISNPQEEIKLSAKDTRLIQALRKRATVAALCSLPGMTRDEALRKLYALCVLELAELAEVVDARPRKEEEPPAPVVEVAAPAAPVGVPFADEDEATMNLLASEFLSFRGKDAFDVLGVKVETQGAALQKAFLQRCAALAPTRFRGVDARGKAEILLMVYARAFGGLSDPDQYALHRKRRENHEALKRNGGPNPKAAAEQFKIRTELLDAGTQFEQGRKRLEAGQAKSAVEHFEYAADIEPSGRTLAWLAMARFRANPDYAAEKSLALLADACAREPGCEEAWAFRGDLALSLSRREEAADAYRRASKLNPGQKRYTQALAGIR
jgi:tetratricopeptide (TPR) repeat protein